MLPLFLVVALCGGLVGTELVSLAVLARMPLFVDTALLLLPWVAALVLLVAAVAAAGAAVAVAPPMAAACGSRVSVAVAAGVYTLGCVFLACAFSWASFVAARAAKGVALGVVLVVATLYTAETLSTRNRGQACVAYVAGHAVGAALHTAVGAAVSRVPTVTFRLAAGLEGVLGVALLLASTSILDSPVRLALRGAGAAATRAQDELCARVPDTPRLPLEELLATREVGVCRVLNTPHCRNTGCALAALVLPALSGMPTVTQPLPLLARHWLATATAASWCYGLQLASTLLFSTLPWRGIGRFRRVDTMLFGTTVLGCLHLALGTLGLVAGTGSVFGRLHHLPASGALALCLTLPTVHAATVAPTAVLYAGEVLPPAARLSGIAVATAASYLTQALYLALAPVLWRACGYYLCIATGTTCLCTGVLLAMLPETLSEREK